MNTERWRQVEELLQSALDRPPQERAAFLERACGADDSLKREVESLILSADQAGSSLNIAPANPARAFQRTHP